MGAVGRGGVLPQRYVMSHDMAWRFRTGAPAVALVGVSALLLSGCVGAAVVDVQGPGDGAGSGPRLAPVVELKVDDVALPHGSYPRVHHPDPQIDAQLATMIGTITAGQLGDWEGSCSAWGTARVVSVYCSRTNTDRMDPDAPPDSGGGAPNPTGWSATFLVDGARVLRRARPMRLG